ncbi:MAG: TonB-dependent receptor plug domain-containing protein, partial [Gemmatimonas sp.]|nr:TonB-dependent receptor plug domain-containing protein [Gemmatimonas sp.]
MSLLQFPPTGDQTVLTIPRSTVAFVIVAVVAIVGAGAVQAQAGTVAGRVLDSETLQPLAAAQVSIAELNIGVLTQQNGRFILTNVPAGSHTVNVQRIGYRAASEAVTVVADQSVEVDFSIAQEALALDEIIVTGTPGGTQRRAIGNVVSRVDASAVTERQPVANMQELLGSRAPGLDFMRASGNLGTGSQIRIRGVNSMELGSQPLIYVDGIRVDNSTSKGPNLSLRGSMSSALDEINPDDIATIEVIKGPAAATLYGTEASAGVVQIITKKGQTGAPQFNLTVNQGTNFMMDPAGKLGVQWACRVSDRPCPESELYSFNIYENERATRGDVFQNGHNQGYSLSVRGGTDAIRYYLSGDWDDQVGILDWNTDDRRSIRANVGVLITEGLNLDVSTGYVTGNTRYLEGTDESGDVWDQLMWAQGNFLDSPSRGYLNYTPEQLSTIETTRDYRRFTGSATLTHTPFEWLTQRLIVGTDYSSDENQSLIPRHPDGANGTFRSLSEGHIEVGRPMNTEFTFDYSASAQYGLAGVGLTSSFGAQYYTTEYNEIESTGMVFASPAIRSIEGATSTLTSQSFEQNKSLGFFVQQEAAINDRIYLTGAVRLDDNSAFGSEFDAAIYP